MTVSVGMNTAERSEFIKETFNDARNNRGRIPLLKFAVVAAMGFRAIPTRLGLRIIEGLSKIKGKS